MEQLQQLELYDIYELWHVPFWQRAWFKSMMVILGVVVIFCMLRWFYFRFLKKKPAPISAWQKALNELQKLQAQSYETKEQGKQFYFEITAILKRYIAARFHLDVYGKTDQELIAYLQKQAILPMVKEGIADIAQGCVFIKFAGQEAMREQIKRHLDMAYTIVRDTTPTT